MPNALMNVGGSTTGDAGMALKYYPVWQEQFANGETQLQYTDWLKQMTGAQPTPTPVSGGNALAGQY